MGFRFSSKLERKIVRRTGEAIGEFGLIEQGDHLLVAVSGGKDSLSMIEVLRLLLHRSPVSFEMTVVTICQGYTGFGFDELEKYYQGQGYRYKLIHAPVERILEQKLQPGSTPCSLCSRIRRGILYTYAPKLGCNKIALGHHLDDLIETLLLNFFYSGQLRSMGPNFVSDDGRNRVIRPLCFVPEAWLAAYAEHRGFPIMDCGSPQCGQPDSRRMRVKRLISRLDEESPGIRGQMLHALRTVCVEHLLDRHLQKALGR
jgi:tRNA 2-thiocytidine biosynthesis protein TtcA